MVFLWLMSRIHESFNFTIQADMKRVFKRKTYRDFYFRQIYFRVVKHPGTPESVARAVAVGLFVGFAVPFGLQIVAAVFLAIVFRCGKILSIAFTCFTNIYTIVLIYPPICYFGALLTGSNMDIAYYRLVWVKFIESPGLYAFFNMGREILVPFLAGGTTIGIVSAFCGYFMALGMVTSYNKRKQKLLARHLSASGKKTGSHTPR